VGEKRLVRQRLGAQWARVKRKRERRKKEEEELRDDNRVLLGVSPETKER